MKHDLALKGNINGVELLVFPSNHLAHASQRKFPGFSILIFYDPNIV